MRPSDRPLRRRVRLAVLTVAAAGLVLAGCADSGSGSDPGTTTAGSEAPETSAGTDTPDAAGYAEAGPSPVGFTRSELPDGRDVVVWYPSTPDAVEGLATETVDLVGFLSADLQAKIPDESRVTYEVEAYQDAAPEPDEQGHPAVVFSHGLAGFGEQSVSLTTHLASWGHVVAAPTHVNRSLDGMLGDAADGVTGDADDVEVITATLDWLTAASAEDDGLLAGTVDPDRVAVAGHSRGASAAYLAAGADDRFGAFIAYSIDLSDQLDADDAPPVPDVPGMVMTGTEDGINDPAASREVFEVMHAPKYFVEIIDAGHLVFSDICEIGADQGGIVEIARSLDLGIPEELLAMGTDGCTDDFPPVTDAFAAIDAASVAFLDDALGDGDASGVLATERLTALGAPVRVTTG